MRVQVQGPLRTLITNCTYTCLQEHLPVCWGGRVCEALPHVRDPSLASVGP
jgi:hypothetical protein